MRPTAGPPRPLDLVLEHRPRPPQDSQARARLAEVIGPSLSPVFVLAPPHAGLSELRDALQQHPAVYAPGDLPFASTVVDVGSAAGKALARHGVDACDLEHMLWDQLLRDLFARSAREVAVLTQPGMCRYWRRLKSAWPAARFVHLVRDPLAVAVLAHGGNRRPSPAARRATYLMTCLRDARMNLPGPTLRFEDLREDPELSLLPLLEQLDVAPEPAVAEAVRGGFKEVASASATEGVRISDDIQTLRREWGYP
jgi:hypothetical protein